MKRLEGKIAIITGASAGIGKASALLFASKGASLGLIDINLDGGKEVCEESGQPAQLPSMKRFGGKLRQIVILSKLKSKFVSFDENQISVSKNNLEFVKEPLWSFKIVEVYY